MKMHSTRPSFTSLLRSIFECFLSQDLQLINLDENQKPYLLSHDYGDMESGKIRQFKSKAFSERLDESSSSSEIELLSVRKIKRSKSPAIVSDDKKVDNFESKKSDNEKDNNDTNKEIKLTNTTKPDDLNSNVFKIESKRDNQLISKLSSSFLSWPLDKKEKYVDQLMKNALKYIQLKDYERAEMVLFELLDILFYCSKNLKNVPKSIEILQILDGIYLKTSRYLETVEVNKLIANICYNFYGSKTLEVQRSLDRIESAYKKMNLDHKAKSFIDEFNRKIKN